MEIPYTRTIRPDTGLYNAKVGIWLFLASEVMLFGGLFSSYIFLRVGADFHWPVHELTLWPGFVNTIVLIVSSVTVVMAWASLKMRKIGQYKLCMWITIACAGIFMCLKAYEYYGKFHHYGVKLTDGTILTGHMEEGYRVKLDEATTVTLSLKTADPAYFLGWCVTPDPKFKNEAGEIVALDQQGSIMGLLDAFLPGDWDTSSFGKLKRDAAAKKQTSIKLTSTAPLNFAAREGVTFSHTANSITFRDGTVVTGKSVTDKMTLQVDKVDVRSSDDEDKSLAWHYLGDEWKKAFEEHSKETAEEMAGKKFDLKDERYLRHVKQMEIHAPTVAEHNAAHGSKHAAEAHAPAEGAHAGGEHHSHYPEIVIDRKDIAFWSNFTPKWNTYYAIYFTLTGLHGMHVVAGALVLAYFLLFDGKRLKEDPEHLANRIEVGGLFWHFVDLVWIFLFPLLYLL